jgi:membrane-associated protease RseP (regulator of RpoE activity)
MRFGSNISGQTMITHIKPNSIASLSDLSIGDNVLSVNGKSLINIPPKDAAQILKNASGVVTIVAAHTDDLVFDEEATV